MIRGHVTERLPRDSQLGYVHAINKTHELSWAITEAELILTLGSSFYSPTDHWNVRIFRQDVLDRLRDERFLVYEEDCKPRKGIFPAYTEDERLSTPPRRGMKPVFVPISGPSYKLVWAALTDMGGTVYHGVRERTDRNVVVVMEQIPY